jgi:hypothetical protein
MFSSLLSLMMVGVFLAVIRIHVPNSLALCIGCHACWVWQIKMSKVFFDTNLWSEYIYINLWSEYIFLVGRYDAIVGPLVTVWLGFALLVYFIWRYVTKDVRII